ncbi:MAG TPA: hypothetical protein VK427_04200 [Kofleriaceae bacterium]|nr:hypothetical protein [Kofleriaceae bacterium]
MNATLTVETDASKGSFGDVVSLAPDVAVGVTDDLTVMLVHSTFGRTGFRGVAGSGICITDACKNTYDNVGAEVLYALANGPVAVAADVGIHATSFERDFYIAKVGAKLRYITGRITFASLPSVFIALGHRDDMVPNRDRLWLPVSGMYKVAGGLSLGLSTGFKTSFQEAGDNYEIAAGALAQYTVSPMLTLGASWVHGKIAGGSVAVPDGTNGYDSRAVHVWASANY